MKFIGAAVAAAALALGAGGAAHAEVRTTVMTWTGTFSHLIEFGPSQLANILTGTYFAENGYDPQPFVATFTIREPWPAATYLGGAFSCEETLDLGVCASPGRYGFEQYGGAGVVTATFEFNGLTIDYGAGSIYQHLLPSEQLGFILHADGSAVTPYNSAPVAHLQMNISTGPNSGTGVTYDWRSMTAEKIDSIIASGENIWGNIGFRSDVGNTWGTLTPTSISIRTSVPEPDTWAILMLGFGMTGAMLRRSRSAEA